jgi:hypothetical protein
VLKLKLEKVIQGPAKVAARVAKGSMRTTGRVVKGVIRKR